MRELLQIGGSVLLAGIPVLIWGNIFYKKEPENRTLALLTFMVGALAVFPILIYKVLWQFFPWINAFKIADFYREDFIGFSNIVVVPLSVVITFMIVGIMEELMKFIAVKVVDEDSDIKNIDDSMELFIIAALGFSFTENILYFYNIWLTQGADNLLMPFLFRSSFSTLAHITFSGVLGYYYGVAHFASPILQEEIKAKRGAVSRFVIKMLSLKRAKLFYEEHLFEGLLISIGLHALFNIFLEMNLTFMIVPFLVGGYLTLNYLFGKKENHKNYNQLLASERNH